MTRNVRRTTFAALAIAIAMGALGTIASTSTTAEAQSRAPKSPRTSRPAAPKKTGRGVDAGAPAPAPSDTNAPLAGRSETAPNDRGGDSKSPDAKPVDAGATEAKTLDGGARVFRFGEVEIEGRLRNPQLVYFLRRVRAEFAAGDLGHRTFMRELSETRKDPSF